MLLVSGFEELGLKLELEEDDEEDDEDGEELDRDCASYGMTFGDG